VKRDVAVTVMSYRRASVVAMVVFSNRELGPGAELLLSAAIAREILLATAGAAAPLAAARWELELVQWLTEQADVRPVADRTIDVTDLAWTPEHFDAQRAFVATAITAAIATAPAHEAALRRWSQLVAAHPRDSVQVGRRWKRPTRIPLTA
jgi:hypothetical protein